MKKWKKTLLIALVISLLLGCVSANAQTSNEYNESDWIDQHKLVIKNHSNENETFSADGVDKAQMNVVLIHKTTNRLAEAPSDIDVQILANGIAKPQNVTIRKGEAISEEITLTSIQHGVVNVTAKATGFEAVNISINFTTPCPEPYELLLEAYYKGKPILADESIWASGDRKLTLRVKLLDKDGQPMYFSSDTYIDISPSTYTLRIPIQKFYGEQYYQGDVQGPIKITAKSDEFKNLNSTSIVVKFATGPSSLRLETIQGLLDVSSILIGDDENVTLKVSLFNGKNPIRAPSNIKIDIFTNREENFSIDIHKGNFSGEMSYSLKQKPGTIKFTAKSNNFKLNATRELKFAVPSKIELRALYENDPITPDNPVPVGGNKKVTLNVELLDKDGQTINYTNITPRRISISTNKELINPIFFPPGVGELPQQKPGTTVNITASSDEFEGLATTIEVKFARPSDIHLEAYSDGKPISSADSILANKLENVILKVSLLDENENPINFTDKDTSIHISIRRDDTITDTIIIPIHKDKFLGVGELPQQKPGTVDITASSGQFEGLETTIKLKFISVVWMMICAGLGGFVMYFLQSPEDHGKEIVSLIRSQGDSARRLSVLLLLIAYALFGIIAYVLYYLGADFETFINIKVVPVGSPLGAFVIGFIGGVALMGIIWSKSAVAAFLGTFKKKG